MIFWRSKKIRYFSFGGGNYLLLPDAPDCYVKQGNVSVGYLQTMMLQSNQLHIDHFAVDSSQIGNGIAEQLLRGFAAIVKEQSPSTTSISFDLGRATSSSDIFKLAKARTSLFHRIGASDIQQRQPNKDCIVVSAVWSRNNW
jgi:predicted GNAT family acetyltransferase